MQCPFKAQRPPETAFSGVRRSGLAAQDFRIVFYLCAAAARQTFLVGFENSIENNGVLICLLWWAGAGLQSRLDGDKPLEALT